MLALRIWGLLCGFLSVSMGESNHLQREREEFHFGVFREKEMCSKKMLQLLRVSMSSFLTELFIPQRTPTPIARYVQQSAYYAATVHPSFIYCCEHIWGAKGEMHSKGAVLFFLVSTLLLLF